MEDKIEQPNIEIQALLDNILQAEPDEIVFCGKNTKVGWLHKRTIRKFTHIMLKDKSEKRNAKLCATILLNNKWKIMFFFWIYWRWLYYIKDVDDVEILRVLDCAKKKFNNSRPYSLPY